MAEWLKQHIYAFQLSDSLTNYKPNIEFNSIFIYNWTIDDNSHFTNSQNSDFSIKDEESSWINICRFSTKNTQFKRECIYIYIIWNFLIALNQIAEYFAWLSQQPNRVSAKLTSTTIKIQSFIFFRSNFAAINQEQRTIQISL